MLGKEEINNRFGFHKATIEGPNATAPQHAQIREDFMQLAEWLDEILPEGRAKALTFTELETASMWAHKAIAEQAPVVVDRGLSKEEAEDSDRSYPEEPLAPWEKKLLESVQEDDEGFDPREERR